MNKKDNKNKKDNTNKKNNKNKKINKTKPDISRINDSFFDVDENENEAIREGENLAEIVKAWLSDDFIHSKTRLNSNQVIALTILKTLAEKYKVKCIMELIDNFVRYKLSEGGQSSKELVDILKSRTEIETDDGLMDAIKPFMKS